MNTSEHVTGAILLYVQSCVTWLFFYVNWRHIIIITLTESFGLCVFVFLPRRCQCLESGHTPKHFSLLPLIMDNLETYFTAASTPVCFSLLGVYYRMYHFWTSFLCTLNLCTNVASGASHSACKQKHNKEVALRRVNSNSHNSAGDRFRMLEVVSVQQCIIFWPASWYLVR